MLKKLFIFFLGWMMTIQTDGQPAFSITFKIEGGQYYEAYHDEPVIFSVSLSNKSLQKNQEWNDAADEWLQQVSADYKAGKISQQEFQNETDLVNQQKKAIKTYTIGSRQSPWFNQLKYIVLSDDSIVQSSWPIEFLDSPVPDSVATLDVKGYYQVNTQIKPNNLANIRPGIYIIQVSLGGVLSNPVTLEIRKQKTPPGILKSPEMLLRLGNYYLQRKDAVKALQFASDVLNKDPHSISALVLRGESYILMMNYKLALVDFENALKQHVKKFPDLMEPPEYLEDTVNWLKTQLLNN